MPASLFDYVIFAARLMPLPLFSFFAAIVYFHYAAIIFAITPIFHATDE
jgi:hypothetical protein